MQPGMFLSQPPIATARRRSPAHQRPSQSSPRSLRVTRANSACRARHWKYRRDTVIVPNVVLLPPEESTPACGRLGQLVDVHIARREIAPGGGNADRRLFEVRIFLADRAEHGAAGRLLQAVDDLAGITAEIDGGLGELAFSWPYRTNAKGRSSDGRYCRGRRHGQGKLFDQNQFEILMMALFCAPFFECKPAIRMASSSACSGFRRGSTCDV